MKCLKWFTMKALVVYESMFGNTEQIARAVAAGLAESVDVQLAEVAEAPADPVRRLPSSWLEGQRMHSR